MTTLKQQHRDRPWTIFEGTPGLRADNLATQPKDPAKAGPDDYSPEAMEWRDHGRVCRDLMAGDVTGYLVQWEGETDAEYQTRQENAEAGFVNWYEGAVGSLVDQVFSKGLIHERPESGMTDAEWEQVKAFWENVERRGVSPVDGTSFARSAAEDSLGIGGTPAILVDYPERTEPATDAAEEAAQGLGPYFCMISPWQIIAADEDSEGRLVRFRYFSTREGEAGEWGRSVTPIIVVLERGEGPEQYAKRRELVWNDKAKEYVEDADAERRLIPPVTASAEIRANFREIPVVPVPTGQPGWFGRCQLRNVAMLNILHFRKRTDYDIAEAVASVPMAAFFGVSEEEMNRLQWGPYRVFWTSKTPQEAAHEDISFGFQTSQTALKTLETIERYIAAKSKDPQSQRATGEEKSTIRMMDEAKKMSRLQAWALGWLQAYQTALQWAGWWLGLEEVGELGYLDEVFEALAEKPTWTDFQNFLAILSALPESSWRLAIQEAQRYGVLSDTEDVDQLIDELRLGTLEEGID